MDITEYYTTHKFEEEGKVLFIGDFALRIITVEKLALAFGEEPVVSENSISGESFLVLFLCSRIFQPFFFFMTAISFEKL